MSKAQNDKFIPALSYRRLTPLYDPVVRLTTREKAFKAALVGQLRGIEVKNALDLACGTGTLTIMLKKAFPEAEIAGIDGDAEILEIAREKAKMANAEIRFKHGLSFDLPFKGESFDAAVSSLFFHHLTRGNKLKTLSEVRRVLKKGGEFHVADWGAPANLPTRVGSYFVGLLDGFETTAHSFGGLLPRLMEESGFHAVEETGSFNSAFGTIRLHRSRKT